MEHADVVRRRRMVRAYTAEPLDEAVLVRLVGQALHAPSAGWSQGWHFVVLTDPGDRSRFWRATTEGQDVPDVWLRGMLTAPALVLCLSDPETYLDRYAEPDKGWDRRQDAWPIPYWDVDTGMAALLICLGAVDEGLGACFFGVPNGRHDAVRAALGVPTRMRLVGVVSVGHRAPDAPGSAARRPRRPVPEVVSRGRFGVPWSLDRPLDRPLRDEPTDGR